MKENEFLFAYWMRFHSHELKLQVDGDRETSAGQARAVFFVEVLHQILVQIQSQPCLKRSKHTKICNAKARVKLPGGCQYTCSHQLMVWCGIMLRQGVPAIAEWCLTKLHGHFQPFCFTCMGLHISISLFWFVWLFVTPSVSFHVWISMEFLLEVAGLLMASLFVNAALYSETHGGAPKSQAILSPCFCPRFETICIWRITFVLTSFNIRIC